MIDLKRPNLNWTNETAVIKQSMNSLEELKKALDLDKSAESLQNLEKIAGEPIDVLVNGKFVAKGEVVVIEESFGVRITEIIKD